MNLKTSPSKVNSPNRQGLTCFFVDWTDAESQSQYTKAAGGEAAQPLWAEEWEDETEETDFSVQLKYEYPSSISEAELICVF